MAKRKKRGNYEVDAPDGVFTGEERKIMEFLNSRLFADVIDSFVYAFGNAPSLKAFESLGLFKQSDTCMFRIMYGSACEDVGYRLKAGTPKAYRVKKDDFEDIMNIEHLADLIGMKKNTVQNVVCTHNHNCEIKGYLINEYNGDIKDFWSDLYSKGYTEKEVFKWALD